MRAQQKRVAIAAGVVGVIAIGAWLFADDGDDDDVPDSTSSADEVVSGDQPGAFRYPQSVSGVAGGRTTLRNEDGVPHTFTSDDGLFDSGTIAPGGEFTIETLPAGTYGYHCSIHADLTGELEITS